MIDLALHGLSDFGGLAIRWAWQATLVAVVILVLVRLLRGTSPALRLALLTVALLEFALPPLVAVPSLPELPAGLRGPAANGLELSVKEEGRVRPLVWPGMVTITIVAGWLFAALALAVRVRRLRRLRLDSRQLDGPLAESTRRLSRRLGLARPPELRVSDRASVPLLAGLLRPVILLPRSVVESLEPEQTERVIAHELVHLRHGDLRWNWATAVLGVLWWFHPLYWCTVLSLRQVGEERCDDAVVRDLEVAPAQYARSILSAAAACIRPRPVSTAVALFSRRHPLERRLARLPVAPPSAEPRWACAMVLALGMALALGSGAGLSEARPPGDVWRVVFDHDRPRSAVEPEPAHAGHREAHRSRHRH